MMRDYNFMSPHAKKDEVKCCDVLDTNSACTLIAFNILNWLFWEILDNYISIVGSVIIILLVAVFTLVIAPVYRYKHCRYAFEKHHLRVRNAFYFWMKSNTIFSYSKY